MMGNTPQKPVASAPITSEQGDAVLLFTTLGLALLTIILAFSTL